MHYDRYLELGVDGVSFTEDLGTQRALMMSPEMFRKFLLPEYEFIFKNVFAEKKIVNFHSCGCVESIAVLLASIGITILNPIQFSANNLEKIKKDTVGKMALQGGIDTKLLLEGTPAEVQVHVQEVMEVLKPGGGYILCPDQGMPNFPPENIEAMWQTAKEYGRYR